MTKLVKLAGKCTRSSADWWRYLWYSMRRNERAFAYYQGKARASLRGDSQEMAWSFGLVAVTFAKSADADRRLLGQ